MSEYRKERVPTDEEICLGLLLLMVDYHYSKKTVSGELTYDSEALGLPERAIGYLAKRGLVELFPVGRVAGTLTEQGKAFLEWFPAASRRKE